VSVLVDQTVWISPRATGFTVVCDACAEDDRDELGPGASVAGNLPLDLLRGVLECRRGHRIRVERDGR
jgi:hypothetical protein